MRTVYLDQNKWIDLAKAFHQKGPVDKDLINALAEAQRLSQQSKVLFPLSWVHYIETNKNTNSEQRKRLGEVMWTISRGRTLASYRKLIRHELENVLANYFPKVVPRPFRLVSTGYAHAFNEESDPKSTVLQKLSIGLDPASRKKLEDDLEKAFITGEGPGNINMPAVGNTVHNTQFAQHLRNLPAIASQLTAAQKKDYPRALALKDIEEPVDEVLTHHGLSWTDFLELGKDILGDIVEAMPSRAVEIHLHRQVLKNPQIRIKENDLEDWGALGPASAHCDVVVCEKQMANLLSRDGFKPSARIITNIRDLPLAIQDSES